MILFIISVRIYQYTARFVPTHEIVDVISFESKALVYISINGVPMLRLKIMLTLYLHNIGNKDCNGALNEYMILMSLTKINHS